MSYRDTPIHNVPNTCLEQYVTEFMKFCNRTLSEQLHPYIHNTSNSDIISLHDMDTLEILKLWRQVHQLQYTDDILTLDNIVLACFLDYNKK